MDTLKTVAVEARILGISGSEGRLWSGKGTKEPSGIWKCDHWIQVVDPWVYKYLSKFIELYLSYQCKYVTPQLKSKRDNHFF